MCRAKKRVLQFIKSWLGRYRIRYFTATSFSLLAHYQEKTQTFIVFKDCMGRICKERLVNIARCQHTIQQFSKRDAHLLGYLLGYEDTLAAFTQEKN